MSTTAVKEELDTLEPNITPRDWEFNDGEVKRIYVQKPLSFFGKIEFFSLLGDTVDNMNTEEKPLNVMELFGGEATADSFVAVISRIAGQAPEVLQEAYCIWLNVPRGERTWAKWVMEQNLTDEEGMQIIELFVDQNAEALQRFFGERGQSLIKKVSAKFRAVAPAQSSKPSKRTRQPTPE